MQFAIHPQSFADQIRPVFLRTRGIILWKSSGRREWRMWCGFIRHRRFGSMLSTELHSSACCGLQVTNDWGEMCGN